MTLQLPARVTIVVNPRTRVKKPQQLASVGSGGELVANSFLHSLMSSWGQTKKSEQHRAKGRFVFMSLWQGQGKEGVSGKNRTENPPDYVIYLNNMRTQAGSYLIGSHCLQGKIHLLLHELWRPPCLFPFQPPLLGCHPDTPGVYTACSHPEGLGFWPLHRFLPGMLFPVVSTGQTSIHFSKFFSSITTSFLSISYMVPSPLLPSLPLNRGNHFLPYKILILGSHLKTV